ncbi:AAA family ATPase [Halorussus ruber]|uniref:AAA family ATPase n=1 Tax=Halorussus ruber TaxID=1126238 RepID=UPI001091F917|nr:AAA family ATPase [Halorussus ruber]
MAHSTAALVGATGGAGTTRLAVELGATLARDGREIAVLDAAFATEGLARHATGRIDTDLTELLVEDRSVDDGRPDDRLSDDRPSVDGRLLSDGLREHPATADLAGRLELCPAYAPFERMARAKTADAAQRFEALVAEAAESFDHVLLDTPPVAANQSVAAVTAAEKVAVVAPADDRGVDAIQRTRGRIADVGASVDCILANLAAPEHPVESADAAIPESEVASLEEVPASAPDPGSTFAPAVAHAAEVVFDADLGLEFEDPGLLDFDADELLPDALS